VKGLMAILTAVFVVGYATPVPKDQACERGGHEVGFHGQRAESEM